MKVGSLSETDHRDDGPRITVTGATPVVDVQSARREMTLNNDILKAIPTARSYGAMVTVVPGVNTNLNDVVTGTATTQFPIHGGRNNEGRLLVDGINIGNPPGGNQPAAYIADVANAQEVTFTTAGGLGESETAGLVMNIVPKTGGNSTTGSIAYAGSGEWLQSDNYTDALKAQGLTTPIPLTDVYDLNGAVGGPLKKDRLWYFVNGRTQGSTRVIANVYYNLNAGDPTKWLYNPDLGQAGLQRSKVGEHQRAFHLAGVAPQQDQRLLGRAGELPDVHGVDDRHHRSGTRVARGPRLRPDQTVARAEFDLVVAFDQQAAA